MNDATQLAVAEQPQQLITIEPTKYVELVFEPFAKRLADAKTLAAAAEFDVTTTAGMAVAVKHRATFREIRVASEKARKERKAPILEIGKLLDTRQKEIEAEIEPFESRFDAAIKAEEKRKDDEKIAKAAADKARVDAIRAKIDEIKDCVVVGMGRSSSELESAISELETTEITLDEYGEFAGEAQASQAATIAKLKEMLTAQLAHEAEQARIAAEREALERQRAELAEQERKAAAARAEQEAKDRAERERVEAEQRAAQERAAEAMRQQQAEHEARMAAQQAEIDRQQAAIDAARAEQERIERERQAAIEAEARAKREAEEAEERRKAEAVAAEQARRDREAREAAEAEAREQARREREQFAINGPGDVEIVETLAKHYAVEIGDVMEWMKKFDYAAADEHFAAANVAAN
jgi:colicin import membrane protein